MQVFSGDSANPRGKIYDAGRLRGLYIGLPGRRLSLSCGLCAVIPSVFAILATGRWRRGLQDAPGVVPGRFAFQ